MKKLFIILFILSPLLLMGCAKTGETPETAPADKVVPMGDRFEGMTEDEKIQEMIKMIEAEEAKMKVAEDTEGAEEETTEETAE